MSEGTQTVDHALATLVAAAELGPRSIREISDELRISPTAARRVVLTLHRQAFLRRREDGRYDIGPRLLRMTDHLLDRFATMAHPDMAELAGETGATVLLSAFRADSVIVLHQVDPAPLELHLEYRTRLSRDLTEGTDGLVILANLNAARRDRLVSEAGTPGLARRLARIRRQGFLLHANPAWGGITGLSAPILDENIGVIGSLTVLEHGPSGTLRRCADALVRAARQVGDRSSALTRRPGQLPDPA